MECCDCASIRKESKHAKNNKRRQKIKRERLIQRIHNAINKESNQIARHRIWTNAIPPKLHEN